MLLYANDMVFFSADPGNLVLMLQCMDATPEWFAMRVNAAETKVMLVSKGESRLSADVAISGGPIEKVDSFKYLGGDFDLERQLDNRGECPQGLGTGCLCPTFGRVAE